MVTYPQELFVWHKNITIPKIIVCREEHFVTTNCFFSTLFLFLNMLQSWISLLEVVSRRIFIVALLTT